MRDPLARLEDILVAVANIERYVTEGRDAFDRDERTQRWIVAQIQDIGEAVRHLPEQWIAAYADVPWAGLVGMRDRIVHGYFNIRIEVVWSTATKDVPRLKSAVDAMLKEHQSAT